MKTKDDMLVRYKALHSLIKYFVNSCVSTVVDCVVVWSLLQLQVPIVVANTIGVVTGFLLGYLLSIFFVWENAKGKSGFVVFFLTFLFGLGLADWLIWMGDSHWFVGFEKGMRFLLSKGVSIVIPFFAMYFVRKVCYTKGR